VRNVLQLSNLLSGGFEVLSKTLNFIIAFLSLESSSSQLLLLLPAQNLGITVGFSPDREIVPSLREFLTECLDLTSLGVQITLICDAFSAERNVLDLASLPFIDEVPLRHLKLLGLETRFTSEYIALTAHISKGLSQASDLGLEGLRSWFGVTTLLGGKEHSSSTKVTRGGVWM
jgi:hypothetical protein